EMRSQALDVAEDAVGGVGREVDARVAGVWQAAAGVALVEEHDAEARRVEQPPHARRAAGAGTAVQHERRLTLGIAAGLPIDAVALADLEQARRVGLDG